MKESLFAKFVNIGASEHGVPYKITETEKVTNYCWELTGRQYKIVKQNGIAKPVFGFTESSNYVELETVDVIRQIKEYIKDHGAVIQQEDLEKICQSKEICREFFSITYSKERDKISLSMFKQGYGWSFSKKRLYPIGKNTPRLCVSKHLYVFAHVRKKIRGSYKPRIYTGKQYDMRLAPYLAAYLGCTDQVLKLYVPYRYMKGYLHAESVMVQMFGPRTVVDVLKINKYPFGHEHNWNEILRISRGKVNELIRLIQFRQQYNLIPKGADYIRSSAAFLQGNFKEALETDVPRVDDLVAF